MLNIDCLVKNTEFIDGVKKYVKYFANDQAAQDKDASFEAVYKHLKENNLEVDIETAGQIYLNELPTESDDNFTKREKVEALSGKQFDETARNLLLGKPRKGEKVIGDLAPRTAIAKMLADAFNSNVIEDHTTKSILRTIQDMYIKSMDRFTGELPNKKEGKDTRPFEQIIQEGLDKMSIGHRNTETGLINNLHDLHKGVNAELTKLTSKLEAEGDPVKAEQWKKYVENFQDAVYSAALSRPEIKKAVDDIIAKSGFGKVDKEGNLKPDWNKLAGDVVSTSTQNLREHVVDALVKNGHFDKDVAEKVANDFQRRYDEIKAHSLEILDKEQLSKRNSYEPAKNKKESVKIDDIVADQVKRWETHIQHEERGGEPLIISKKTAADALKHAIIESGISRERKTGNPVLDIDKLSERIKNPADIKKIASEYFADQKNVDGTPKYDADKVDRLSNAIDSMYQEMFNKVREHVEGKQAAIENTWNPDNANKSQKSDADIITKRLTDWSQFKKITGKSEALLRFTKNEAQRLYGSVLKNTDLFGKERSNGERVIDWHKLAEQHPSQQDVQALIEKHLIDNEGYSKSDAKEVANSLARDYHADFEQAIKDHANALLELKQAAIERESPERKNAIQRLAELHSLGIFEGNHEKLLYHVLGVDAADVDDINTLKEIAQSATELRNELGGKDYLGGFLFKHADRLINHLIEKNKDNHAKSLSIVRAINHTFELMNMGLISNPYNMVENNWSGLQAIIGTNIEMRKELGIGADPVSVAKAVASGDFFKDRKLWWAVWKDVAVGGVKLGGAGDKWSHLGSFVDNLNSINIRKNPIKALKTLGILIPRAMLNASDAANKAVLAKKGMMFSIHQAMLESGWDSEHAAHHIYEAIYGQSFEEAKIKAGTLIEKYGTKFGVSDSKYARDRATIRLANDLVIANLNLSSDPNLQSNVPIVNDMMVEAAMGSGFHAAAVSLGHEANNPLSRMLKAGKKKGLMKENKLLEDAKNAINKKEQERLYNKVAEQRLVNNLWYNGVLRMQSGAANWAKLRIEGTGIGVATGLWGGDMKTELDFTNKETLQKSMQYRIDAQRKVTRGLTGLTTTTLGLVAMASYGLFRQKQEDEDEDEGVMQSAAKGIHSSYILNRSMNKFGPDLAQLYYLAQISKGEGWVSAGDATYKYAANLLNLDPSFTIGGKIAKAGKDITKGEKGANKAAGEIGSIYGDMVQVPFYKAGKQFYDLINHAVTGKEIKPVYVTPMNVFEGMFGGGLIQDIASQLPPETLEKMHLTEWAPKETE